MRIFSTILLRIYGKGVDPHLKRTFLALFAYLFVALNAGVSFAANNCTGATYYDADNDTCINCPTGYTDNIDAGKTDISQCQRSCAAGTYIATPPTVGSADYTRLEYIENPNGKYIDTGFKHNPNATTVRGVLRVGVSTNLSNNS